MTQPSRKDDRLFVRDGRRSYRRRYSRAEVRWGEAVLGALAALLLWVIWKGAHPDPSLFAAGEGSDSSTQVVIDGSAPSGADRSAAGEPARGGGGAAPVPGAAGAAGATGTTDRAPFPAGLALAGWNEGAVAHYDSSNLYEKINGREDYYKSFGFRRLHWVSLATAADPATTVDVELFDLRTAANALGAYAGERPPEIAPHLDATGMWHRARNAAFATVGRYYARIVGADESAAVLEQVEHVRTRLAAALPAEPLPWGYALFAGGMGVDPGRVTYVTENAFSLGFARRVYTAKLGDDDLEGFVVAAVDAAAAAALAQRFGHGFRDYGEDGGRTQGLNWVRDRYLHTVTTAKAHGAWVVGVRGAADPARGGAALARIVTAIDALPAEVTALARAEAASAAAADAAAVAPVAPAGEPGSAEPEY